MRPDIINELFYGPDIDFTNHLALKENNRILFSGRYGIGKTTFIKWYFEQNHNKEKYNVIHLYPINYAVASNEDIFKYVKMDILVYLLENTDVEIEHLEISKLEYLPYFLYENVVELFLTSLSIYASIKLKSTGVSTLFTKINDLREKFNKSHLKAKNDNSDLKKTKEFMNELLLKEGSLFEFNFISELIVQLLDQWRTKSEKQEVILILDDLDRIDPHHIFRLFNVFAAHFDHPTLSEPHNKFGFEKVVFVADVNNIKNIFHTQFGISTDFSGYIDKFYSQSVFSFNNIQNIKKVVGDILEKFPLYFDSLNIDGDRYLNMDRLLSYGYRTELSFLLSSFVSVGRLNLRVLSPKSVTIKLKQLIGNRFYNNQHVSVVLKIEILVQIVGSLRTLIECFEEAERVISWKEKYEKYLYVLSESLPLFNAATHQFNFPKSEMTCFFGNKPIVYSISNENNSRFYGENIHTPGQSSDTFKIQPNVGPSIFSIYLESIKELQSIGYF